MFLYNIQNLLNTINVSLIQVSNRDKDIFQIYDKKNIEIFYQNLINILLKDQQYIKKFEQYYLIFEITILNLKLYFLFISFTNLYDMVEICQIRLNKLLNTN